MDLRRNQQGGFMVEVIAASTLLLFVFLSSGYWMNRVSHSQATLRLDSAALNQARLQMELEIASATADPASYLNHINAHQTHAAIPVPNMDGATLTMVHRTHQDPSDPTFNTLADVWITVTWPAGSGTDSVTLFSSIYRR